MSHDEAAGLLRVLGQRYGVTLDFEAWKSKAVFGGIAIADEVISALANVERRYGGSSATVYEMETTRKEFQPVTLPLTPDELRNVRHREIAHFDVVVVPHSRRWAIVMSTELEAVVFGTDEVIDVLPSED